MSKGLVVEGGCGGRSCGRTRSTPKPRRDLYMFVLDTHVMHVTEEIAS